MLFSNVRVNVEGDDAGGYRVQLRMTGETQTFYVVKVDGAYRILTVEPLVGPAGRQGAGADRRGRFRRRAALARLGARRAAAGEHRRSARRAQLRARLDRGRGDGSGRGARRRGDVVSRQRPGRARGAAAGRGARRGSERRRQAQPRSRAGAGATWISSAGRSCVRSPRGWWPPCRLRRRRFATSNGRGSSSGSGMRWRRPRASGWRACPTIHWRAKCSCVVPRRAASSRDDLRHHAAADRQRPRHGVRLQPVRVDRRC